MGRPAFVWSPLTIPPTPSMSLMMWTRIRATYREDHSTEGSSLERVGYLDRGIDDPGVALYNERTGERVVCGAPVISEDKMAGPAANELPGGDPRRLDPPATSLPWPARAMPSPRAA